MKTVARHRACRGCGYDLFTLPADGVCPECGRGIGGVRKRRGPKNPRRVAGQLRRMVAQGNRDTYLVAAFWFVPLLGLAFCWWSGAPWWVWGIATLAFLSGVIQHLTERAKRQDWTQRLAELDGDRDAATQDLMRGPTTSKAAAASPAGDDTPRPTADVPHAAVNSRHAKNS